MYKVKVQLRDTVLEFDSAVERDKKFNTLVKGATGLGIPPENIIVSKIDTQYSSFLDAEIEKIVEVNK